tara:strand:- start:18547 stop:19680 length:1134 start_codon:yes stop_codon:yes gene_type:complete
MKILITGGAGFIGSNLAKKLIKRGHDLRILDNFSKQIHGNNQSLDSELDGVDLIIGDVRNKSVITQSLDDVNAVVHLAAETGTGQSMYQLEEYQHTNISGTLNIINHLLHNEHSVEKIIVASSRAIYGEGRYSCKKHGVIYPDERSEIEMSNGQFDHKCKLCNRNLEAEATPENARIAPLSFYGITKQVQEQIVTMYAKVLGISGYSLRYQNVYGPGQSLMNPYTGIMAIFSTLARNNQTIRIFEDGNESRDFVYIDDVIDATIKCLSPDMHGIESFNIGSGNPTSVYKVAESIINNLDSNSELIITGEYRSGDIRHNYANLEKSAKDLSFISKTDFNDGLKKFLEWALLQPDTNLNFESSLQELSDIGLLKKSTGS